MGMRPGKWGAGEIAVAIAMAIARERAMGPEARRVQRPRPTFRFHRSQWKGGQPLEPVRVMPWMKYFWAKKKRAMTGRVMRREPAIIMPKSPPCWTLRA